MNIQRILLIFLAVLLCWQPALMAEQSVDQTEQAAIEEEVVEVEDAQGTALVELEPEINEPTQEDIEEAVEEVEKQAREPGPGCVWVDGPQLGEDDFNPGVDDELKAMLNQLKWETNTDFVGMGSPEAKKGGTLQYVESSFPPTLRTCGKNANSAFTRMLEGLAYENLLGMDPITYGYVPSLAKKWALGDDRVSFFYEIDERARWSDGNPVVANDVVQSWKLYTNPGIDDPFYNSFYMNYEEPVAISDRVVMVRSKSLNWRAFMSVSFMTILPGHILEKLSGEEYLNEYQFKFMPGSGPYEFRDAKVNEEINLIRRLDWWQADLDRTTGMYNFDRLKFIFIQDENLVKERFKAGAIDWIYVNVAREWHQEFTPAMMPQIARGWVQRRKIYTHSPNGVSGVAFNMRRPPFDDIRIRKAFAHLYNREKMMDKLFFNEYEYTDSFYPKSPYENPDNPKVRYNPDKAVELLEEAGWLQKNRNSEGWLVKDGHRLELTLNYVAKSSERILTIFQEDLRDVGIKLNLKQVTWATDIKEVGERNFQMSSRAYTGILFPNPESSFHSRFADLKNNNNIWGLKNERIDEILAQYPLMFDPRERVEAVREIDGIVSNLHLYAFGWYGPSVRLLYWNKFGMPDYVLSRTGDQRTLVSLWWYDEEKHEELRQARANRTNLEVGAEEVRWWDEHYPQTTGE